MLFYYFLGCTFIAPIWGQKNGFIENFAGNKDISLWVEHSDTVQSVGKSKASLVLQQTSAFQRAVLFTLVNPQPCGAGFAGVKKHVELDLGPYTSITLKAKGQGQFHGYKMILKQSESNYSFCNFFQAPNNEFEVVSIALNGFKPYHEGKIVEDPSIVLNKSKIRSIGIQAYGGLHLPIKQKGVASLEIDWIRVEH